MAKKTLGMIILAFHKEQGMTQAQLGEKMNVTEKAVSNGNEICSARILYAGRTQ